MPAGAARRHHGDTSRNWRGGSFGTTGSDRPASAGADTILGLRGEDRFSIIDSSAGPGESPVRSRFPFSFYIFQLLEGLKRGRGELGTIAGKAEEEALEREFSLLRLDERLHGRISRERINGGDGSTSTCSSGSDPFDEDEVTTSDEDFLRRYVHDFTCMMLPSVRGMSRLDQASFVLMLLDLEGTRNGSSGGASHGGTQQEGVEWEGRGALWSPTASLVGVHHRFWKSEHKIRLYFKLLDAAGPSSHFSATRAVEVHIQNAATTSDVCSSSMGSCGLTSSLHISLTRAIQVALLDKDLLAQCFGVGEGAAGSGLVVEKSGGGDWASRVDRADRATTNILALVGSAITPWVESGDDSPCAGGEQERVLRELLEGWGKLRLMRRMVLDVIQPLRLRPEAALGTLMSLQRVTGRVRSEEFMRAVVTTLSWVVQLENVHDESSPGAAVASFHSSEQPKLSDVLPQYLETYMSEVTASPTSSFAVGLDQTQPTGHSNTDNTRLDTEEGGEYGMWELLTAVLSGDSSFFLERWAKDFPAAAELASTRLSKVFPREAACVRVIRWLNSKARRTENATATTCLRLGLLREHQRTSQGGGRGVSNDERLAVCFVAAREADLTVDEVHIILSNHTIPLC